MCNAFSCIVDQVGKVTWKLGVDSHSDLARLGGYEDKVLGGFAKIEITPKNRNYLNPDEWVYRVDASPVPKWCGLAEKELCLAAHKKWLKQLDKILVRKKIVKPFELVPPEIERKHVLLLKKWVLVRDSVGGSVRNSAWGSVGGSVWGSVWDSVGGSVCGYVGSFFRIPVWKYVKHPKGKYPYQSVVTLWNQGLVPSLDGTTWRLHGGPKAAILFSISKAELEKYK
jgi:hypothetical protein